MYYRAISCFQGTLPLTVVIAKPGKTAQTWTMVNLVSNFRHSPAVISRNDGMDVSDLFTRVCGARIWFDKYVRNVVNCVPVDLLCIGAVVGLSDGAHSPGSHT